MGVGGGGVDNMVASGKLDLLYGELECEGTVGRSAIYYKSHNV